MKRKENTMDTRDAGPVVLCYDRSVGSLRAIETASALFPGHATIVLHVWNPVAALGAVYGAMVPSAAFHRGEAQRAAMQVAEEGAALANEAGLEATAAAASAQFDGTSTTILKVAEQHDAEVIVLGARGLSALRSVVLGSVSHAVVQRAHCPVLVVPPVKHAEAVIAPVEPEVAHTPLQLGIVLTSAQSIQAG
jgi:nucleotide-binding universal stress UspA family protein